MSLKSAARSMGAAARRMEREERRRQRELEKRRKELGRMEELQRAAYEVEVFENDLEVLTSMHEESGPIWDWEEIVRSPEPDKPTRSMLREEEAKARLESYEPNMIDRLLRREDKRRARLREGISEAREEDERQHEEEFDTYAEALSDWQTLQELGHKVLEGDTEAMIDLIKEIDPFTEISELGSSLRIQIDDPRIVTVEVKVHGEDVIPKETKSLLKSGKLSVKNMPKTHYYALYQDHVCSSALRMARELFALLPIEGVIVNQLAEVLNTKTGHLEERPILSVAIPRATHEKLNYESLDPSDSMENFVHNMNFRKIKGFAPVERITADDVDIA